MIYLTFAVFSCFLLASFNKVTLPINSGNGRVYIGECVATILFGLLAAERALTIGTDTMNYYYSARNVMTNYHSIAELIKGYYIESGYGLLEYLCMHWFGDIHYLFLFEAVLLFIGVFIFIHSFEDKISISLAFFVFFAFYYNSSLNISRQYIAVSIGFIASKFLLEQKPVRYFALCLMSVFFHSSGIMLFISYFIWLFIKNDKRTDDYIKKLIVMVSVLLVACFCIRPITSMLVNLGMLPAKYLRLLGRSDMASSFVMSVIANLPLLLLIIVLFKKLIQFDDRNRLVIALYLLGFCISLLNTVYGYVGRLAVFWSSWQIILYPQCFAVLLNSQYNIRSRSIIRFVFPAFFLAYWSYCIIIRNFGSTYPYVATFNL